MIIIEKSINLQFTPELQYLCLKSVFAQALEYKGCSSSLLKLRIGFELKIILTKKLPVINKSEAIMPFFKMNDIKSGGGSDTETIFKKNAENIPIIVIADVYYLPFRKEYKKYHASHAIFFWNYDEENQRVFIIDWYTPHFFKGYISASEFKEARGSTNQKDNNPFSGNAINNVWFAFPELDKLDNLEKVFKLNIQSIFREENLGNVRRGISAITYLKHYFKEAVDFPDNICQELCRYFHEEMLIYYRSCMFGVLYFSLADKNGIDALASIMQRFCTQCLMLLDQINYFLLKGALRNSKENIKQCQLKLGELENLYVGAKIYLK